MIRLPTIALSSPPSAPGGGVISVKTCQRQAAEALPQQDAEDQHQPAEAEGRGGAATGPIAIPLRRRRRGVERVHGAHPIRRSMRSKQVARNRQHDEGDDEEDQAERDQRRRVEVADRFGEFVGDGRGDRGARRQDRRRDAVRVADHEGDGHGLAERAAEPEHDAADHADPRIGQHDVAEHFPGGAAEPVGGFLEHRRNRVEHVARDRGDERQHHDREDEARGQHADAVGRTGEQRRQQRDVAEHRDQERLQASAAGTGQTRTGPRCRR